MLRNACHFSCVDTAFLMIADEIRIPANNLPSDFALSAIRIRKHVASFIHNNFTLAFWGFKFPKFPDNDVHPSKVANFCKSAFDFRDRQHRELYTRFIYRVTYKIIVCRHVRELCWNKHDYRFSLCMWLASCRSWWNIEQHCLITNDTLNTHGASLSLIEIELCK